MFAPSRVRLYPNPGDEAAAWRFELTIDGAREIVVIRDVLRIDETGLDSHEGLAIEADVHAGSEDEARGKAVGLASLHLTALAIMTRAPVDHVRVDLVYETTPGRTRDLDFTQTTHIDLPLGKVPAPGEAVVEIQQALLGFADPTQRQPILLAAQMYAAALHEVEPVLRFSMFWPACEALDRPLRRILDRNPKDRFWGLKALAERQGEVSELIDTAYELRNNLFHAEAGVLDDLVARADDCGTRLESLLAPGLLLVLGLPERVGVLPQIPSSNHPTRLIFRGRLRRDTDWGDEPPHAMVAFETAKLDDRRGQIRATFTLVNADGLDGPTIEIWGPAGPNLGKMEFDAATVTRSDGDVEPVKPDGPQDGEHHRQ